MQGLQVWIFTCIFIGASLSSSIFEYLFYLFSNNQKYFYLGLDVSTIFEMCSGGGASKEQEGLTIEEALEVKCLDYLEAFLGLDEEIIKREFKNIDEDDDGRVTLKESLIAFKYLRELTDANCYYVCPNMIASKLVNRQRTCPSNYVQTNIPNPYGGEPYSKNCTYVEEHMLFKKLCIYVECVEIHRIPVDTQNYDWVCPDYPYPQLLTDTEGPCTPVDITDLHNYG